MNTFQELPPFNELYSVFLAIPLPGDQIDQFEDLINKMKKLNLPVRFQKTDTPHITLQYWKNIDENILKEIYAFGEQFEKGNEKISLNIAKPGYFGPKDRRKVMYFHIESDRKLETFANSMPWKRDRPFSPHLTILRVSDARKFMIVESKVNTFLENVSFSFDVDRVWLYGAKGEVRQMPYIEWKIS